MSSKSHAVRLPISAGVPRDFLQLCRGLGFEGKLHSAQVVGGVEQSSTIQELRDQWDQRGLDDRVGLEPRVAGHGLGMVGLAKDLVYFERY